MLTLIRSIHTIIWTLMVAAIFYILHAGITGNITAFLWVPVGIMSFEGLILLVNKGSCPLTLVAKDIQEDYQEGDDIYLPKWVARYNKLIFGTILIIAILLVLYRLISV